jgi:protein-S-isoprenylcysteine O-methyltransferase Ste14
MPRPLPPLWFLVGLLLIGVLHLLLPGAVVIAGPWRWWGLLPVAVGIACNLVADAAFKRYATTMKPYERPSALVTDGVFRLSRNPMYLGMALVLVGLAWVAGSVTPWLVPAAFVVLIDRVYIDPEERMLAEGFPASFAAYRQRVRRWL